VNETEETQTTQVEQDIEEIFDFLTDHGPFEGDSYALAEEVGVPHARFQGALGRIRKQTEENGWTIPFVRRGPFSKKVYAIVPTEGAKTQQEEDILLDGVERQSSTLIGMLDNVRQQAKVLKEITTPRTRERKWANQLLSTTTYLVEQGEMMLDEQPVRTNSRAAA
jgi:hypothetical protein